MNNYKLSLLCLLIASFSVAVAQNSILDTYLVTIAAAEGLSSDDIDDYDLSSNHQSKRSGLKHFYYRQRFNGIEIFETQSSIHLSEDGNLYKYNNAFVKDVRSKVLATDASITHAQALGLAILYFDYDDSQYPIEISAENDSMQSKIFSKGSVSRIDIPIKLMYYLTAEDRLKLCYDISISEIDDTDWWSLKIDAETGEMVSQINWTVSCNFEHDNDIRHICSDKNKCSAYKSMTNNVNPDTYKVYAAPTESPNHGVRTVVQNPADLIASPFGWHDTNGATGAESTKTIGNNVLAQEDQNANNGSGYSPDGGTNLVFDFPIDFTMSPVVNRDASLTNLFFWNNIVHDVWYQYGFDEASGNFQENNYGNGGNGSDSVNADGLDGNGINNANFSTPPDGGNPRMQMFLWSPGTTNITTINSPSDIAGDITGITAGYGPNSFDETGDIILVDDGSNTPTLGCNALINAAAVNGNIALVDRGTCDFAEKSLNAQSAGAIAVIICQNTNEGPFTMSGGSVGASVNIPSIMISKSDCDVIKSKLPGVNITLTSTSTGQQVDGSFDNGIIAHEYGHGISIRLTGGSSNSGCLNNSEQMGEGWSDYFGMIMTIKSGDVGTQKRGVGTFAISQPTTGDGIRDFPYSTDMSIDPRTYDAIKTASVPHGVGSTWCAMLWEMTWSLIDAYGFDPDLYYGIGGNNIAMALVTEGLKLQPCSPGFIDGRDAILAADQALYGGQNECLIWAAFAKRGLGFGASQGSSSSRGDGTESFISPTSCEILTLDKTVSSGSIIVGDTLTYTLVFDNQTSFSYTNLTMSDTLLDYLVYVPNSATNGAVFSNEVVSISGLSVSPFSTYSFSFQAIVEPTLTDINSAFIDDVENGNNDWVLANVNAAFDGWVIDDANPYQGLNSWFAENTGNRNNKQLTIKSPIQPTSNSVLKFWHTYSSLDNIDGGIVEISIDNQITWLDLGNFFTQNGYDNFLFNDPTIQSFGGSNNTAYVESIADLSSFAGENVFIRFTMFHSKNTTGIGWNIDDIELTDLIKTVNNIGYFTATPNIDQQVNIFPPTQIIPASCSDDLQNGTETGVDTGGSCTPSSPCDFDLVLSGNPAAAGTFQAQNEISSSANVGPNTFYFANAILLENDFEVELGVEFLADINPCTAFNNDDELALNVVATNQTQNQNIVTVDINIPEEGTYLIQFKKEDGTSLNLKKQRLQKGIHRVKVKTKEIFRPEHIRIKEVN